MPLYEYRCAGCGAKFELLRRMQDADAETVCPECGSPGAGRQLSVFASHMGGGDTATAPCGAPASACNAGRFR
ncbi:MAG: FmdB family zinc ribbon protein [Rhodospirillales bacterium]